MNTSANTFFGKSKLFLGITLAVLFLLGLAYRLYDLADPPLDFHSTRQMRSALIARGMYYQWVEDAPEWEKEQAIQQWKDHQIIEPPIFETITAWTYRIVGGEHLWIARIYAALFWLVGGFALYSLARDMTSVDGGIIAAAFYLFLPFGVVASRSFQPDPLMVAWIIIGWYTFYRWYQTPTWKNTLIAGVCAGIALFVKNLAIFFLLPPMAVMIFFQPGIKKAIRDRQVWVIAILSALPVLAYTLYGIWVLNLSGQFEGRFFPELLKDPAHYIKWFYEMEKVTSFPAIFMGLLGTFIFPRKEQRGFVLALWVGYVIYGLLFPYHFLTHSYYHLPLVPLVGLTLAPLAAPVFRWIRDLNPGVVLQIFIVGVLLFGAGYQFWQVRLALADDYRHEPAYWEMVGEAVGHDKQVVALSQDYSQRIAYYGRVSALNWPGVGQFNYRELRGGKPVEFPEWFAEYTAGKDFFLVTRLKELDRQPELKDALYTGYPIYDQGEGYIIFDLKNPLTPNP
jgi:4-amino-4-deoxy-L-arabinose transferase-like glycosyltransferase